MTLYKVNQHYPGDFCRPRKDIIQKAVLEIKDDIVLANASHSLRAYSNLWGLYHVFVVNIKIVTKWQYWHKNVSTFWKLSQFFLLGNVTDKRKQIQVDFSFLGRRQNLSPEGKVMFFKGARAWGQMHNRTNCWTEQEWGKREQYFISFEFSTLSEFSLIVACLYP